MLTYITPGTPMTDLQPLSASNITITPDPSRQNTFRKVNKDTCVRCNSPGSITFVRNRMLYARAALNAKGKVTFGLRHIRKNPSARYLIILTSHRCFKSLLQCPDPRAYGSRNEIHLPQTVWIAQCVYFYS